MPSRTTSTIARFSSPFLLPGFDTPQPAGEYRVEYDEEMIEVSSRLAWRRVGAFIHLPAVGLQASTRQMVPVVPADLEAALELDAALEKDAAPVENLGMPQRPDVMKIADAEVAPLVSTHHRR